MLRRVAVVFLLGLVFAIFAAQSAGSTPSTATDAVGSASPGGLPTNTMRGTYHLGHTEYIQNYDAVTTAKIEWKEDTDAPEFCHCRQFFPGTGTIDWTYRYEVLSESIDCNVTVGGQLPAGRDPPNKGAQMIALYEIPGNDEEYYFTATGGVDDSRTISCEGESPWDVTPINFTDVPLDEDIVTPSPTFPGGVSSAGSRRICDAAPFKIDRDAKNVTDSCYLFYFKDEFAEEYVFFEWNVDLCLARSNFTLNPTANDTDGDRIPNGVEDGIGTNKLCPDTDGDGLMDSWEVEESVAGAGFDLDGNGSTEASRDEVFGPYAGECGTVAFGGRREPVGQNCGLVGKPDPLHKDVYVEMDWQDCFQGNCPEMIVPNSSLTPFDPSHHAPDMLGLLDVVNVFDHAPVSNPDGNTGVKLHILVDEAIAHTPNCDKGAAATRPTNFGTPQQRTSLPVMAAKGRTVRYAWSGHSSVEDDAPGACPLPPFSEILQSGFGLAPLPYYDISPHGFAQPRGRDILVTLAVSWICQLYTPDSGEWGSPCFRTAVGGLPVVPGLFPAEIARAGGGTPRTVAKPQHVLLGVSPSQGVRQLWGRTFANLLGYSLGVPGGSVRNDPNAYGAHPPDSYAEWEKLDYAPPRTAPLAAQGDGGFVPILPDFTLAEQDGDGDGTAEGIDNCPAIANPEQLDLDLDGWGDGCDTDDDGDGMPDGEDATPLDTDNDGTPNASDGDDDDDAISDIDDNCPLAQNALQENIDGDEAGDACDGDSDDDGEVDGLERATGSDPLAAGSLPEFLGLGDSCTDAADNDGDGDTDGADDGCVDADGDTVPNSLDNCPGVNALNVADSDDDGVGDACEPTGDEHAWGDNDCNGSIGSRDGQALTRNVLAQAPLSQTQPCPAVGASVTVGGTSRLWGDIDCNGAIGARDGQALLRKVLAQNALSQTQPCPAIGETVAVAQVALLAWSQRLFGD